MNDIQPVNITDKDWKKVEEYVKAEKSRRETDPFRKKHERIWKEVDRQVTMEAAAVTHTNKNDWHSAIELGELAKASEIIGADVMRLTFPTSRAWFEAHCDLPPQLNEQTGQNEAPSQKKQNQIDGGVRAMMTQQHLDFGLKARVNLSIKEALHHGSYVAEARQESAMLVHKGSGIQTRSAPVWVPHSMWNCYPDTSPSVMGTSIFYTGSMIIKEYMPLWKLRKIAEEGIEQGWMPAQLKKIPRQEHKNKDIETKDVELIKYFGDLSIDQGKHKEDIFLPNSKVILANGVILFYAPNDLPFSPIIYNGYERLDVRDPYYTSPLIKLAPTHKLASTLANKFIDNVSLHVEPPGVYDANDPQFIESGGPDFSPGSMKGTKYMGKGVQFFDVGDPNAALSGLQFATEQLRSGTSVDSIRAGGGDTSNKTAQEIRATQSRSEVRVVDFVEKLEFSLKSFLYMQHVINKTYLESYSFYNPEMDSPDFMRVVNDDIPNDIHFEVVGARGVLGEEERNQKMTAVTAFASGNPMFSPLLKPAELLLSMYQDAGVKGPERYLNMPTDENDAIRQEIEQKYQAVIEEGKKLIEELEKKVAIQSAVNDAKVVEAQTKASSQAELAVFKAEIQAQLDTIKSGLKIAETEAKLKKEKKEGE